MISQQTLDEQQETSTLVPWVDGNYRVTIRRESDENVRFFTAFKVFMITLTVG